MSEKPLESDPGFNRQAAEYSARLMDQQNGYHEGETWSLQYLDPRDNVHHFATVLKIEENNYRFFHTDEEAEAQRALRGLPKYSNDRIKYNVGLTPYRPVGFTKVRL